MTTLEAVRLMLVRSGMSSYRVALGLGRASSYVAGMLRRGSCPSADLLAKMAHICGYRLDLVPYDGSESIHIDGGGAG